MELSFLPLLLVVLHLLMSDRVGDVMVSKRYSLQRMVLESCATGLDELAY